MLPLDLQRSLSRLGVYSIRILGREELYESKVSELGMVLFVSNHPDILHISKL